MPASEWHWVRRAVRSAKSAGFLGPRIAARAAAAELSLAPWDVRIAVAAVLARQGAKSEFLTDVDTFWRELQADDRFRDEMSATKTATHRRRQPVPDRHDPLPIGAARAVPIIELFQRYGHDVRRAGAEWVTRCPFHDDQRPSLALSPVNGLWYCHPCGLGGDGIAYVMQRKGIDFAAAVREVAA